MRFCNATNATAFEQLSREFKTVSRFEADDATAGQVTEILAQVRRRGDQALIEYSRRFDGLSVAHGAELEVPLERMQQALEQLPDELADALKTAHRRIKAYAEYQKLSDWHYTDADGMVLGQRVTPLDKVGLYVPGGTASYPSSVLMGAVPAVVAGVGQTVVTVPAAEGRVSSVVLAAAALAGVDRLYTLGGAQAIAALTWGTETVPAVDKICGPGNAWVTEAKRQVYGLVGIDMLAGPSEIVVIADRSAPAEWLAADMLAQSEHDVNARAVLISDDRELLDAVIDQLTSQLDQLENLGRGDITYQSIINHGRLVLVASLTDAVELVNRLAPEHLQIITADNQKYLTEIRHAGAIFLGAHTAEVLSDYCAGPNHVLPTMRCARFSSPLGAYTFQKRSTVFEADAASVQSIVQPTAVLAEAEGLPAHAAAARRRARRRPDHQDSD